MMIAIDGPAGAGKSTVARLLAKKLGFRLLDTGAIYRCLALWAQQQGVLYTDEIRLTELAKILPFESIQTNEEESIFLQGKNVTKEIRMPMISEGASQVSQYVGVRDALLPLQRKLAQTCSCVVEGRDIGTVVLPEAQLKFFLTANPEVRAQRRFQELQSKGVSISLEQILAKQGERDQRDAQRAVSPLLQAQDAIFVDTSELTLEEVVEKIESMCREKGNIFVKHAILS